MASLNASVVTNLRCEYLNDPLGIDITKPHLSWVIEEAAGCRGIQQAAYQVLVASTPELLAMDQGDLWDSGKVLNSCAWKTMRLSMRWDQDLIDSNPRCPKLSPHENDPLPYPYHTWSIYNDPNPV